jgi:hypothetical protein
VPLSIEFFRMLDSRNRDKRFRLFGLINEPNCVAATEPDPETGLWLDVWQGDKYKRGDSRKFDDAAYDRGDYPYYPDPRAYPEYGEPSGIVGMRKFKNPRFDKSKWDVKKYFDAPWAMEPPYLVGFSCAFCHMSFNPLNPPKDPENPRWENLAANMGNQYFREGDLFLGRGRILLGDRNPGPKRNDDPYDTKGLDEKSLLFHYATTQQPGTSETSRISYDFINNPNTINSIFNLGNRPLFPERTPDGDVRAVNHVLKDGADSVGIEVALLRVWINIGCEGRYWVDTLYNPATGHRQRPLGLNDLRLNARDDAELSADDTARRTELRKRYGPDVGKDWAEAHRRNPNLLAYLASYTPYHLKDAPGGKEHLLDPTKEADGKRLANGKAVFAARCAACHSSKQPMYSLARTPKQREQFFLRSVQSEDFLDHNTLSDDVRYSVAEVGTNMARALATNAVDGDVWAELSSKDYKALPALGRVRLCYTMKNGRLAANLPAEACDPDNDIVIDFTPPGGGRGYYRTPSLVSMWATAPYFHNNALGDYYVVREAKGGKEEGWISSDGTRWKKAGSDRWEELESVEVDYRIDTSIAGRLRMFEDGITKLLWPERREGWIKRVRNDCRIVDLRPLFEHLLPGILAELLYEYLAKQTAAEVDAYLKDKPLPPAVKEALRAKILAEAAAQLKALRDEIKSEDVAALKKQLVALAKDKLVRAVAEAAGPDHAEAVKTKLAGLHEQFAAAADKLLSNDWLTVPAGTPVNLYFNLSGAALPYGLKAHLKYRHDLRRLAETLLQLSDCPDLVEDRGHTYGADLTDQEKKDLIEYLKML